MQTQICQLPHNDVLDTVRSLNTEGTVSKLLHNSNGSYTLYFYLFHSCFRYSYRIINNYFNLSNVNEATIVSDPDPYWISFR